MRRIRLLFLHETRQSVLRQGSEQSAFVTKDAIERRRLNRGFRRHGARRQCARSPTRDKFGGGIEYRRSGVDIGGVVRWHGRIISTLWEL